MNIKVLMFGWEFPPHKSGGLGTACHGLTKALVAENIDLTFVLPKRLDNIDRSFLKILFANIKHVNLKSIELETLLHPYITSQNYKEILESHLDDEIYGLDLFDEVYRYGLRARRIALVEDFDVIHVHDWLSSSAGIEAKKVSGKPLIMHVHATEIDRTAGHPHQGIYDKEREAMHFADKIIAVSQHTKNTIVDNYDIVPEKVVVVHNGNEYAEAEEHITPALEEMKEAGKKIVLFVGRITIQKGVDYFIKAAQQVLRFNPNTIFVVSGSGDMESQMIRLAADLGISKNVIFAGWNTGDDLKRLYKAADLVVMPSVSEPFGLIPVEALSVGTPVLISKQSGVSEVLTHALKSDFWDTDDMTDKILGVIGNDCLKGELSFHGKNNAKLVTWTQAAKKCIDVYQQMRQTA